MQTSFLYLYPIFNSGTIQEEVKDLLDSEKFNKVDTSWHTLMNQVREDLSVLNLGQITGLERGLKANLDTLDRIQKNLSEYLESKQRFFPRFYFLPNEDLIEILGDSQKPRKIQHHLSKIFEGVDTLGFRKAVEPT